MNVLVAGGGTGGHVVPLLAVSARLKQSGADVMVVGHGVGVADTVAAAGFPYHQISAGKLRRYFAWQNFLDPFRVVRGVWQSWRLIGSFKPDVAFGKGGYAALPVVLAARLRRVPVVIHESDMIPGLANRLGARYADQVAVAWPPTRMHGLPEEKLVHTGNPLREGVINGKAANATRTLRLSAHLPVVLVLGGSLGAQRVNELVWGALPKLLQHAQVVHGVGNRAANEVAVPPLAEGLRGRYHFRGSFGEELFDLYAAADVVISRAGANTLGELAATGKPSILLPLSTSASDHQQANAALFAADQAAVVLDETTTTSAELAREVSKLLKDAQRRAELGRNIRRLAHLDAVDRLSDLIRKTGGAT